MLDGTRLRQSWYGALDDAQTHFRHLLTSPSSSEWRRIPVSGDSSSSSVKGKARASSVPELTDVIIHRRVNKSGENVYRAVLDVPSTDAPISLESWKSILATPELRREWDPAVEAAQILEMIDPATRVSKVNFRLGWPANPRDAVMISRTIHDATTLIDISTSLPRSSDEPAYLRPSPPYVRSDVTLFAWCIQLVQPQSGEQSQKSAIGKLRITCFWQHNLRAVFNFGSNSSIAQQLSAMTVGLFKIVQKRGSRVPLLTGYGNGVSIERIHFNIEREALTLDYSIVPEDEDQTPRSAEQGLDELQVIRESRRLTRSVEFVLPSSEGWDVQLVTKASSEQVSQLPWTAHATRSSPPSEPSSDDVKFVLGIKHASPLDDHSVLKVRVVIELSGPSSGLRLNGILQPIEELEDRSPSSYFVSQQMLQDASSTTDLSFHTQSSVPTVATSGSRSSIVPDRPQIVRTLTQRSAAAEKSILSRVKRNYIYFSSLLQEPEAKWKRTVEARGVSVSQLDSIDPTLVVYRAEATFVGIGLWDLYAAIVTPGARAYWDKLYDDAVLLEDVNELTELWHHKTKPAWPVNGRDAVVLKTVYKSPTTIHAFSFSADDPVLFPNIPPVDPNFIRAQVDLQGWAIEALSPTTTLVTLLEQSDPKGWSNKASIPQQMITALAGVGEFAIKCGGPPIATRLEGAKANQLRYDHERGNFRIEYEGCASRRTTNDKDVEGELSSPALPVIECELRCDLDTWASSLDIVVDPPPQSISCLRRHRLSAGGGGLWLTITHDAVFSADERLQAIVRRGPMGAPKEKGLVMVNGARVEVDVEEMPEREMKNLSKKKRVKPARVPLDQPPVLGVIRKRRAEWDADANTEVAENGNSKEATRSPSPTTGIVTSSPTFATSFTKFFTYAVEQATTTTQQAVAAISPAMAGGVDAIPSASKPPMQYALEALDYVQSLHSRPTTEGWTLISEKDFPVHRKLAPEISPVIPIHKGEKVIEGVSAEEIASVVTSYDCRKQWDTRFDSVSLFEAFGADAHTCFAVMKGGFPFRDRGFFLASLTARESIAPAPSRRNTSEAEQSSDTRAAIFCVAASFSPDSVSSFAASKYNSYILPVGRVFVDGWILETLDPYGAENFAIPSTRCTRIVAVDYAGSIPAAVNSMINGMLPKSILAVETYIKGLSPAPTIRLPAVGISLAQSTGDSLVQTSWSLKRRDPHRMLVSATFDPVVRQYWSLVVLNGSALAPVVQSSNDRTPRPSRLPLIPNSGVEEGPRSEAASEGLPADSSPQQQQTAPARSHSPRARDSGRSTTMFTTRGEVRVPMDLLISELIVDSKSYIGGYEVKVRSRIQKKTIRVSLPPSSDSASSESENVLPISYAAYTLPPSPLYSAGLNADRPPRHLLRFTLPTAQYQVSTIQDPLTGEIRSAPPKPQWLLDLEDNRAIIEIWVGPAPLGGLPKATMLTVNGATVTVLSEKESLKSLGRDELLDSRISKTDLLSRSTDGEEQFPEELQTPLAVAEYLLEPSAQVSETAPQPDTSETENSRAFPEASQEAADSHSSLAVSTTELPPPESATSGLMRFLNGYTIYPNPLLRFTTQSRRSSTNVSTVTSELERRSSTGESKGSQSLGAPREGTIMLSPRAVTNSMYPLSTVVIIALIAFLMGSLLRSLLSPADFIYVVTDQKEMDNLSGGWREIKRLFEVKYILGGWDFQIAVVRRH